MADEDDQRRPDAEETAEDREASKWLEMLEMAERAEKDWHDVCDRIDKQLADLESLARSGAHRQLQIFWANMEVLKPATYMRPPVPVVAPRFRDRESLPRTASEVLERALVADVERDHLHETLQLVRDDMLAAGRGVSWVRLGVRDGRPAAICDHVDRQDFRMSPARKWREVEWVARRAYLTREQGVDRFGDVFFDVSMEERSLGVPEGSSYKGYRQAEVWEIWHRSENAVVWVSPDCEKVLDIREPWLTLEEFFPCPKPASTTLQRSSLIPVPDFVYYRDQIEEINLLTARISALAENLRMRGFYAAGHGDVAEAVEAAIRETDDRSVLVPISNFAALGGSSLKDAIVWLPLDEAAKVITDLVALRRQMIEDVYEVTGLSDIMRGATQASETATAQQLKAQYGSIRIQTKQGEIQRVARDILRIKAEIMAEQVPVEEIVAMSQVQDVPTQAEVMQAVQQLMLQAQQAGPEAMQQAQAQVQEYQSEVTVEQVGQLLADQRMRPFAIEIETDSTIAPDENAEKQRRVEFLTSIGGFIQSSAPTLVEFPELAPFAAEALRFAAGAFRAGRSMDDAIDQLAERIEERAAQPQEPDPMQQAMMQAQAEQAMADVEKTRAETAKIARDVNPPAEPVSVDPLDAFRAETDRMKAAADVAAKAASVVQKDEEMDMRSRDNGGD